jgi:hypothetical protein
MNSCEGIALRALRLYRAALEGYDPTLGIRSRMPGGLAAQNWFHLTPKSNPAKSKPSPETSVQFVTFLIPGGYIGILVEIGSDSEEILAATNCQQRSHSDYRPKGILVPGKLRHQPDANLTRGFEIKPSMTFGEIFSI